MMVLVRNKKFILTMVLAVLITLMLYRYTAGQRPTPIVSDSKTGYFFERNIEHYKPMEVLLPYRKTAPDTIHMLWCGRKWFEFKHYLSVVSIMKVQQPNKIVLHYWENNLIIRDRNDYNLWYQELSDEYYNIVTNRLGATAPDCTDDSVMIGHVMDILKGGGIYVNDTVVINQKLHDLRYNNVTVGLRDVEGATIYSNIAFIIAKRGYATAENLLKPDKTVACATSGKLCARF